MASQTSPGLLSVIPRVPDHASHMLVRVPLASVDLGSDPLIVGRQRRIELGRIVECRHGHVAPLPPLWVEAIVLQHPPPHHVVVRIHHRHADHLRATQIQPTPSAPVRPSHAAAESGGPQRLFARLASPRGRAAYVFERCLLNLQAPDDRRRNPRSLAERTGHGAGSAGILTACQIGARWDGC